MTNPVRNRDKGRSGRSRSRRWRKRCLKVLHVRRLSNTAASMELAHARSGANADCRRRRRRARTRHRGLRAVKSAALSGGCGIRAQPIHSTPETQKRRHSDANGTRASDTLRLDKGAPTIAKVVLEIEVGSEPISGGLFVDGQPERPFSGWLSLSSFLEQLSAGPFGLGAPSRSPAANDRWLRILRQERSAPAAPNGSPGARELLDDERR